MHTNQEFTTTIIKHDDERYTLKKGSYILLRESKTSIGLRKKLTGSIVK